MRREVDTGTRTSISPLRRNASARELRLCFILIFILHEVREAYKAAISFPRHDGMPGLIFKRTFFLRNSEFSVEMRGRHFTMFTFHRRYKHYLELMKAWNSAIFLRERPWLFLCYFWIEIKMIFENSYGIISSKVEKNQMMMWSCCRFEIIDGLTGMFPSHFFTPFLRGMKASEIVR